MSLVDDIDALAARVAEVLNDKAEDDEVVKLAGTQTITGAKTFSTAPQVPVGSLLANPVRRDDARLTDAREPLPHEHDASDITDGTLSTILFPPTLRNTISLSNSQNNEYTLDVDNYFTMVSLEITMNFNSGLAVPGGTPVNHHQLFIAARAQGGARTFAFASGVRLSTGLTTRSFDVPQNQVLLAAIEYVNLIDAWVLVAATVSES